MDGRKKDRAVFTARLLLLPAAAGFIALLGINFILITAALVLVSAGLLCAPLGGLYSLGIVRVVSDLAPYALMSMGFFCLFFGIFICFFIMRFAPFCVRLLYRYCALICGRRWRRIYSNFKITRFMILSLVFSVISFGALWGTQYLSLQNGFESTVVTKRLVFDKARYVYISTSSLDFQLKYHNGQEIIVDYTNDSEIIVEESDINYLRLVQDDSFTVSLFAREQFSYKMTVWLPENDYREFYLNSGSGDITLFETQSEYTEIHTRSGNIILNEASGKINAATADGNIFCSYYAFVNSASFENKRGNTEIFIPNFSGVSLEFRTEDGWLESSLLGLKERIYGSIDLEKPAPLSRSLYITSGSGGVTVEPCD